MNGRFPATAILLCCLLLLSGTSAQIALAGDGSGTSNPALLRGTFAGGYPEPCSEPGRCILQQQRTAPAPQTLQPTAQPTGQAAAPRPVHLRRAPQPIPLPAPPQSSAHADLRPALRQSAPGNCEVLRAANIYSAECVGGNTAVSPQAVAEPSGPGAPARSSARSNNAPLQNVSASAPIDLELPQTHAPAQAISPMVTGSIGQPAADQTSAYPVPQRAPRRASFGYPPADNSPNAHWSLTLRGGYYEDAEGGHYEAGLVPEVSVKMPTGRGELTLDGSADLSEQLDGKFRVNGGEVSVAGTHALDAQTDLSGQLRLGLSQDRPKTASDGSGIVQPPQYITGSAEAGVTRRFGRFGLELSGSALREMIGKTIAADGTETDNTYRNRTGYGFGARLDYELTPILSVFEQLRADREAYDAQSPSLGAFYDNWTYSARTGVAAKWQGGVSGEASVGYAFRNFDDGRLQDQDSIVYGAKVSYSPSGRLSLAAEYSSDISDTGDVTGATARFGHDLTLRVNYLLSEWLQARATAAKGWASYAGSPTTEDSYSYGLGADLYINSHLSLSADYAMGESSSSTGSTERTQRITAGVKISN